MHKTVRKSPHILSPSHPGSLRLGVKEGIKEGWEKPSEQGNSPTSATPMAPGTREDRHAWEMRMGTHLQSTNGVALRLLRGDRGLHLHGGAPEGKRAQGQS